LIGLSLFIGALLCAYGLQLHFGGEIYSYRSPSSSEDVHIRNLKDRVLQPKQGHPLIHTEKLKGPLRLTILGPTEETKDAYTGNLKLRLQLQSEEDLGSVQVKWILPAGVSFISGDGSFDGNGNVLEEVSVARDEVVERVVYLQVADNANYQVHVQASSGNEYAHFTEVGQYNTLFEPFINPASKSETLEKSTIDEPDAPQFKVFE